MIPTYEAITVFQLIIIFEISRNKVQDSGGVKTIFILLVKFLFFQRDVSF